MTSFWILGAGRFGLRAGNELIRHATNSRICIIDHNPEACQKARSEGFQVVESDGIAYLSRMLTQEHSVDWIIPAIPVHVAYKWMEVRLSKHFRLKKVAVPSSLLAMLPNPIKGPDHTIYTSIADFLCPEDCPMPHKYCTATGQPRRCSVQSVLHNYDHPVFKIEVIRSLRLAPGVGGFPPRALLHALNRIKQIRGPLIIGTACSCHGVVDAFQVMPSVADPLI